MKKKVILMILDGWGIASNPEVSAIDKANTPFVDSLYKKYPHAKLNASGLAVGLPEGQMGNSEVGHMNLGAGRVVYQDLVKINKAVAEGELKTHPVLVEAFEYAKSKGKKVHFIGLVSDGGVHAHIDHLKSLCDAAKANGVEEAFIHAFTDGRDTDPKSGVHFLNELKEHLQHSTGKIASVVGRYYAMDRDKRWERVKLAYDALVHGEGEKSKDIISSMVKSYANGVTDEFIRPIIQANGGNQALAVIEEGDVVINFNFRTDRGREITQVLTQEDFDDFNMKKLKLHYITFTGYDETFSGVKVLFEKDNLNNTLGQVLEANGKKTNPDR
jgi:2,3-bisphosphoglycerate-independent phosphoglycerate mutase